MVERVSTTLIEKCATVWTFTLAEVVRFSVSDASASRCVATESVGVYVFEMSTDWSDTALTAAVVVSELLTSMLFGVVFETETMSAVRMLSGAKTLNAPIAVTDGVVVSVMVAAECKPSEVKTVGLVVSVSETGRAYCAVIEMELDVVRFSGIAPQNKASKESMVDRFSVIKIEVTFCEVTEAVVR